MRPRCRSSGRSSSRSPSAPASGIRNRKSSSTAATRAAKSPKSTGVAGAARSRSATGATRSSGRRAATTASSAGSSCAPTSSASAPVSPPTRGSKSAPRSVPAQARPVGALVGREDDLRSASLGARTTVRRDHPVRPAARPRRDEATQKAAVVDDPAVSAFGHVRDAGDERRRDAAAGQQASAPGASAAPAELRRPDSSTRCQEALRCSAVRSVSRRSASVVPRGSGRSAPVATAFATGRVAGGPS